jgi:mono/diheme cytochrome c family protein
MMIKHVVWVVAAAIAVGLALFLVTTAVGAGDLERGKMLYSARCVGCHDKSVHQRDARKAKSIEGLRTQIKRWDAYMGGAWRDGEVDDVATYLNDAYYRFPCPPSICPEKKAESGSVSPPVARR